MPLLQPCRMVRHITDLPPSFFAENGLEAIILDVDNTLTTHGNPIPAEGVPEWIGAVQETGVRMAILSNNTRQRVEPFAKRLGLDFVSMACKPLSFGVTRACKRYGLRPKQVALIGDQIFTDILSGNVKGVCTILVEPYQLEKGWFFRLKRRLERPVIRRFRKREGTGV